MIKNFLNPKGHENPFSGSKVTGIILKGWIWPIGGALAGEGLRSRLVYYWFHAFLRVKSVLTAALMMKLIFVLNYRLKKTIKVEILINSKTKSAD